MFDIAFPLDELKPLLALVAGVVILAAPKLLNTIVAIYLILIGLVGVSHLLPL